MQTLSESLPLTSESPRHRAASKSSCFATLGEKLIKLILPGAPPTSSKTIKPSAVFNWTGPYKFAGYPKPSQVFSANKPVQKVRFVLPDKEDDVSNGDESSNDSSSSDEDETSDDALKDRTNQRSAASKVEKSLPSFLTPFGKVTPLRVTLMKHLTTQSGIEMPARPVALVVDEEDPDSSSNSDDNMEQRMNEFERWNQYD